MRTRRTAPGAFAVSVAMLMIGNDLYVFKSQYIGIYDTAAVGAVKRTAVPKQAGESRRILFRF